MLADEFKVDAAAASRTVSATVLGIALSILPFGRLRERYALRPIILIGGAMVAGGTIGGHHRKYLVVGRSAIRAGLVYPRIGLKFTGDGLNLNIDFALSVVGPWECSVFRFKLNASCGRQQAVCQ